MSGTLRQAGLSRRCGEAVSSRRGTKRHLCTDFLHRLCIIIIINQYVTPRVILFITYCTTMHAIFSDVDSASSIDPSCRVVGCTIRNSTICHGAKLTLSEVCSPPLLSSYPYHRCIDITLMHRSRTRACAEERLSAPRSGKVM